jgi:hypothetical protein
MRFVLLLGSREAAAAVIEHEVGGHDQKKGDGNAME